MKLKINAVNHSKDQNRFCGPSIISAVTGMTTGEAARLIRLQSGKRKITGTSTLQISRALGACGIKMGKIFLYPNLNRTTGPTLAAWLRMSRGERIPGRVFLVVAGWHWQLISGRRYVCGRTGEIVSIRDKRVKRRARVAEVYLLTSENVTKPAIDVSRPKDPFASARGKTRRLAKKLRVNVEIDNADGYRQIWVLPPPDMSDEEDPLVGHVAYDWDEALDLVQTYETHLVNNQ